MLTALGLLQGGLAREAGGGVAAFADSEVAALAAAHAGPRLDVARRRRYPHTGLFVRLARARRLTFGEHTHLAVLGIWPDCGPWPEGGWVQRQFRCRRCGATVVGRGAVRMLGQSCALLALVAGRP